MPASKVSPGKSKLCHRKFAELLASITTRFPESKSCKVGCLAVDDDELEEDQMVLAPMESLSRITSFPPFVNCKTPEEFPSGVSLLATHTTVLGERFLYHIQKYMLFEFPMSEN